MQYVLYIFALVGTAVGTWILYYVETESHSAIHQIAGFIVLGVAAIFLVGGAIVDSMSRNAKRNNPPPTRRVARRRTSSADPSAVEALEELDEK